MPHCPDCIYAGDLSAHEAAWDLVRFLLHDTPPPGTLAADLRADPELWLHAAGLIVPSTYKGQARARNDHSAHR